MVMSGCERRVTGYRSRRGATPRAPRLLIAVAALLAWLASPVVRAAGPADGPAIERALSAAGVIEEYFTPQLSELVGTLVETSGRWRTYGVNRPYQAGAVNVYLVDAARLPEPSPLWQFGIRLGRDELRRNALADEGSGILFVDTGLLKSLVTVALLDTEGGMDTIAAVALVRARGLDAFRHLWDPARNPALHQAEYGTPWVIKAQGAAAFVLAHEMGHLAIGARDIDKRRVPRRFANDADAANALACDDLIQKGQRQSRAIEQAADDFAVDLLARIRFPAEVVPQRYLRFETGAEWYMLFKLSHQMADTARVTKSENIRRMLRLTFGPEVFDALAEGPDEDYRNAVSVFFPESHPAYVRRAAESLSRLADSPYSVARAIGSGSGTRDKVAMLEMLLGSECSAIQQRGGE